jgi:uncharacterized radical SAM superfamily protein
VEVLSIQTTRKIMKRSIEMKARGYIAVEISSAMTTYIFMEQAAYEQVVTYR